jgi:mannose-6-phosphate isomerase
VNSGTIRPGRAPARLAPIFVPRIWGARDLSPLFPERSHEPEPIGEAWLTGNECAFASGEFAGRTLGEVWPSLPEEWTGTGLSGLPRIPLLVKFIFPEEKLSVQVHPDDAYAEQHESAAGGVGKTEMWYVVSAREGAAVRVGLNPNVTRESFQRAVVDGTAENCLASVAVHPGDAVFVPAGTAHTICPGVVLCEIQQHSDITYRVFDYNRVGTDGKPRALHIRQALDVMQFGEPAAAGGGLCDPVRITRGAVTETFYAACRHFATERWEFRERIAAVTSPEHFDLLIFLEGKGRVEFADGVESFAPAEVRLIPAALGAYQLAPDSPTTLLRAYVPDLNEFVQRLTEERIAEAAWSRVVHL